MIGILCGLLICIMLAVILNKGKQEEKPISYLTETLVPTTTKEPEKRKEPNETEVPNVTEVMEVPNVTEVPIAETEASSPKTTSAPLPTPNPTQIPTSKPIPKETQTPLPIITNAPLPMITETPTPVITPTPAPAVPPTSEPIVTDKEEEAHVHQFEKAVWELPTCEKGGYYNNVCKECGAVECITQEPIPHEVEDIVIQEGNCMEDRIIRHICKMCEQPVESDTRYTVYDKHSWTTEQIEGEELEYCAWCGVAK